MTPRQLGKKLREYGIESQSLKIAYDTSKGYKVEQFEDAFARYLHVQTATTILAVTGLHSNVDAGLQVTDEGLSN